MCTYNFVLRFFFFFTSEKHTGWKHRGNGQLWNGYTSDEVPQGEQSVWILKNGEYAVFFFFFFAFLWGVRSSPQRIFALQIGKRRQARDTLLRQPLNAPASRAHIHFDR